MNLITQTPSPNVELVAASNVPALLQKIRPAWQAKSLINRVRSLLEVDPSSACQRLLNASIHDLREKVVIAGIDIAKEAAIQFGLPPVETAEDVESYSTSRLVDLAYRMGILSRPEWRRVSRCYEIRRDLEHEDDEYEAGVEDCVYIFNTCIEVILARDPVHLLKVTDVKNIVEEASPVSPSEVLVDDFSHAPQPRQEEIFGFLISTALNREQSDIVQQNAFNILNALEPHAQNPVRLKVAENIQKKVGRDPLDKRHARVAKAAGALAYLRQNQLADFFNSIYDQMVSVGISWSANSEHGEMLRSFQEVGGLKHCPNDVRAKIIKWLVLTYIGSPGGRTRYGNVRHVYYSNTAAPIIDQIIHSVASSVVAELQDLKRDKDVRSKISDKHIARRFEDLLDIAIGEL